MTTKIRTALAAVITSVVLVLAGATPAHAATTCSYSGAACVWTSANYSGTRTVIQGIPCVNITPDNAATSVKVNSSPSTNKWTFYIGYNCDPSQGWITLNAGTSIADLSSTYDNKWSSAGPGNGP